MAAGVGAAATMERPTIRDIRITRDIMVATTAPPITVDTMVVTVAITARLITAATMATVADMVGAGDQGVSRTCRKHCGPRSLGETTK